MLMIMICIKTLVIIPSLIFRAIVVKNIDVD